MSHALAFLIPGKPVGQGSKRHVGAGRLIESSPLLRPYRALVTDAARQAMERVGWVRVPRGRAVNVEIEVKRARPKTHYRANGELKPLAPQWWAVGTPDVDKVERAILDALTDAPVWVDDSQVACLSVSRVWTASQDHVYVYVTDLTFEADPA